jgi:hypothetical protein
MSGRLAKAILEDDQRRIEQEVRLRKRDTERARQQLAELEDNRLADIALIERVRSGRIDELRNSDSAFERETLREGIKEFWDALVLLEARQQQFERIDS